MRIVPLNALQAAAQLQFFALLFEFTEQAVTHKHAARLGQQAQTGLHIPRRPHGQRL